MIQSFNRDQVKRLSGLPGTPHVTLFLPASPEHALASDGSIGLGQLIEKSHQQLAQFWMSSTDANDFLRPLFDLQEDPQFLAARSGGVAIYLSEDVFEIVPGYEESDSRAIVAGTFCLRPMLLTENQFADFYLLTISKQKLAFYRATLSEITQIQNAGFPVSFENAVRSAAREPMLVHTGFEDLTRTAAVDIDEIEEGIDPLAPAFIEYIQQVDEAVCAYLHDRSGFLILAGSEAETDLYREHSVCTQRVGKVLTGNIDQYSPEKLLREAMPLAVDQLQQQRDSDAREFRERQRPVTLDAREILCAAQVGRIDTLFFDRDATLYGSFHRERNVLQESGQPPQGRPREECRDLIESAMVQTIIHGGRIHAAPASDMPVRAKMAATLKY
ncbi:hypothetical protein CA51_35230 [Rosistilla oblonga]|uniref:Uncharacterized protein n=1 Tax=Rosistilla oblonga TaxID=2527990 RepID=A0A518IYL6_9BACT|nr:hypothetical protein [Rosistilla oblonga]QDV13632.1 hypothetical protein CA51_35230 [Rosistilla oblonga]QDV58177.1 hypothetical protein Mal33_41940 [Rosistilla oblonga]